MKIPGVAFHQENLTITVQGEWCDYELDNEACWSVFGNGIQGTYCPWGQPYRVDWRTAKINPEVRK